MLLLLTITQFIKLLFYTQTLTQFSRTLHFSHRNFAFLRAIQFHLINQSETHLRHVVHSLLLSLQFVHTTTLTPKCSNTFQLKLTCCCFFFSMHCILSCTLLHFSLIIKHPSISIFLYSFPCSFIFSSLFEPNFSAKLLRSLFLIFFFHEINLCIDLEPLCVAFLASL